MCYSQLTSLFYISCILLYGWPDGWMDGWKEGWAGGWVDARMHTHTHTHTHNKLPPGDHSLHSLSYNRSTAASKVSSPQSAI